MKALIAFTTWSTLGTHYISSQETHVIRRFLLVLCSFPLYFALKHHFLTAKETISRFESVVAKCVQQKVRLEDDILERQLLDQPNDWYVHLKRTWLHSRPDDRMDLEELFASVRDDDEDYHRQSAPLPGSAALADLFRAEVAKAEVS